MAAARLQRDKKAGDALAIGFVLISGKMVFRQTPKLYGTWK
jgi:hypothetical protein